MRKIALTAIQDLRVRPMASVAPVIQTTLPDLNLVNRGKVRDVYAVDKDRLLIVATDRKRSLSTA